MNIQENIRRILREESLKQSLLQMIKDDGYRSAIKYVDGISNLLNMIEVKTPMQFLDLYNNMEVRKLKSTEWVYSSGNRNVMIFNNRKKEIFIDYHELRQPILDGFNISINELRELVIIWLWDIYKIKASKIHFNPINQYL
jgi:hypothetical protein